MLFIIEKTRRNWNWRNKQHTQNTNIHYLSSGLGLFRKWFPMSIINEQKVWYMTATARAVRKRSEFWILFYLLIRVRWRSVFEVYVTGCRNDEDKDNRIFWNYHGSSNNGIEKLYFELQMRWRFIDDKQACGKFVLTNKIPKIPSALFQLLSMSSECA